VPGIELRDKGDIKNAGNGEESIHLSLAKNIRFRLGGADVLAKNVGVVPLQSWERFQGRTIAGILCSKPGGGPSFSAAC
jgi:hypothetical protein